MPDKEIIIGFQFDKYRWWLMSNGIRKGDKEMRKLFFSKDCGKHSLRKKRFKH